MFGLILGYGGVCGISDFRFHTLMGEFTTSLMELRLTRALLPSSHSSFLLLFLQRYSPEINPFHRQSDKVNSHYPYERLYSLPVVVTEGSGVSGLR